MPDYEQSFTFVITMLVGQIPIVRPFQLVHEYWHITSPQSMSKNFDSVLDATGLLTSLVRRIFSYAADLFLWHKRVRYML